MSLQTCTLCSPAMMLPSSCSAAAHQRIHKHRAPHVCPECGGSARQASFQTHLDEACMHFARRIGYRSGPITTIAVGVKCCHVFSRCIEPVWSGYAWKSTCIRSLTGCYNSRIGTMGHCAQ